jgi:hypothetical protein
MPPSGGVSRLEAVFIWARLCRCMLHHSRSNEVHLGVPSNSSQSASVPREVQPVYRFAASRMPQLARSTEDSCCYRFIPLWQESRLLLREILDSIRRFVRSSARNAGRERRCRGAQGAAGDNAQAHRRTGRPGILAQPRRQRFPGAFSRCLREPPFSLSRRN